MFYGLHGVISQKIKLSVFKVFLVPISVEVPSVVVDLSGICHWPSLIIMFPSRPML
jgi:hypothetical protein